MVCAPVAAPNPAVLGVRRAGSIEPSARVSELRMVRTVGLLYWIVDCRPLITTVLNALNTSRRTSRLRAPPSRISRISERSTVLSGQPRRMFRPDSRPRLPYVGPVTEAVLNWEYWLSVQPFPGSPTYTTRAP